MPSFAIVVHFYTNIIVSTDWSEVITRFKSAKRTIRDNSPTN